jgi:hypothetical protein
MLIMKMTIIKIKCRPGTWNRKASGVKQMTVGG